MIISFKIFENSNIDKINLVNKLTEEEALNVMGFKDWKEFTPDEINRGFCEIWAKFFYENIGGKIMKTFVSDGKMWSHVFIMMDNKYFDAEIPYGTDDILNIPYIKRWMKECDITPNEKLKKELLNSFEEKSIEYIDEIIEKNKRKRNPNFYKKKKKTFESNTEDNLNDNFWKWFGDSKVIDKNGKPLVVYHGSHSEFSEFDGVSYFTDDYMNADGYASGEYVYEVYLSMKNPLIIDANGKKWDKIETPYGTTTQAVVGNVDGNKYDGVIFNNIKDSWIDDEDYQDPSTVYVTFSSNQIKSVDNDGTWNVKDNDIYS